jgi:hypothetical protein
MEAKKAVVKYERIDAKDWRYGDAVIIGQSEYACRMSWKFDSLEKLHKFMRQEGYPSYTVKLKNLHSRDRAEQFRIADLCKQLLDYAVNDGIEDPELFVENFRQYIGNKIETRFDQYTGGSLLGIRLLDIALNFKAMYGWKIDHAYYVTLSTLKKLKRNSTENKLSNNAPVLAEIIELLELRQDEKRQAVKPFYIDIQAPKYSALMQERDNVQGLTQWRLESMADDIVSKQLDTLKHQLSRLNTNKLEVFLNIGDYADILEVYTARNFFKNIHRTYKHLFPKLTYVELTYLICKYW